MRLIIEPTRKKVSSLCSEYIVERIAKWCEDHNSGQTSAEMFGLCISGRGVVMSRVLDDLVSAFNSGAFSFRKVAVFATDEFVDFDRNHPASQHHYLYHRLFKHVDILRENVFVLNGNCGLTQEELDNECKIFEDAIISVGGIELAVMESEGDGSIGRNNPGSSLVSRTRQKTVNYDTAVEIAEEQFDGDIDKVPKVSLTIGLGTLFEANELVMLFSGIRKAQALAQCTEHEINHMWPCSFIQRHRCSLIFCDEPATSELRVKTVRYFKGIQKIACLESINSVAHLSFKPSTQRLRSKSTAPFESETYITNLRKSSTELPEPGGKSG